MDATQELIAIVGRQAREIAERDAMLASAAELLERGSALIERAEMQNEALRRLTKFVFAEPKVDDLTFYASKFMGSN